MGMLVFSSSDELGSLERVSGNAGSVGVAKSERSGIEVMKGLRQAERRRLHRLEHPYSWIMIGRLIGSSVEEQ
jgi:hypothetical protein